MAYDLSPLVAPRSVAIVGANADPETIGGAPLRRLLDFGYSGQVHLVSRRESQIEGIDCVATVSDLPTGIDVALLAVPGGVVPQVLSDLVDRDVRSAIVFASGFAETGEAGRAAQARIVDIARSRSVPVTGPNCLGLINFVDGVPLTFSALEARRAPQAAGLSIVSQSGAMAMALTYAAHAQGVDVAYTVSTGNEAVIGLEDYLDHLIDAPMTRVIALLIEQVRDPARFLACARRAREAGKPIIALKAGRSDAAREAAMSHTGALAGDYETVETVLGAEAVLLVDSIDELIDLASLLVGTATIGATGTALLTESGSVKTLALDSAVRYGATFADLSPATVERLVGIVPEFAEATNPIDITGQALLDPSMYGAVAQALLDDAGVEVLIASTMPGTDPQTVDQVESLLPVLAAAEKAVVYTFAGGAHPIPAGLSERIREAGVPVFPSFDRALRAIAHAERRLALVSSARRREAQDLVVRVQGGHTTVRDEHASKAVLSKAGIEVPSSVFAPDADSAVDLGSQLSFPLAVKGVSEVVHKTEAGAVVIGVRDRGQLEQAVASIAAGIAATGHELHGYLVEEMAPSGIDLIVGARRDDDWGVVLLVGFGGVLAEATRDTVLLPGSATADDVRAALDSLRAAALLRGFRGDPPADVEAVVAAVLALGAVMRDNVEFVDIDVNPLRALSEGHGAVALDGTIVEVTHQPSDPAKGSN